MTVRLFHPTDTAYRLAVVSIKPASEPGMYLVAIGRGASRLALTDSTLLGPYPQAQAEAQRDAVVTELKELGYLASGIGPLLHTVQHSKSPRARAHAATRLGWRKETAAAALLRQRGETPKRDITSVVLALGRMADDSALPLLTSEAEKRVLSRRRAGAEAIRLLGDADAIAGVQTRATARLHKLGIHDLSTVSGIWGQVGTLPSAKRGAALDALYDLGTPPAVGVVRRAVCRGAFTAPGTWRYTKSILKRSMQRIDGTTFALIMRGVEQRGRTAGRGATAVLKSGLDGKTRSTRVFSRQTADWLRRAAWRFMVQVGRHEPHAYTPLAAAVLALAEDSDDVKPRGRVPASGHSYLLMRTLYSGGNRYEVDSRRPIHRARPGAKPTGREDAFAELWDQPDAAPALRALLVHAKHRLVTRFALQRAKGRPEVLQEATTAELVSLLRHPSLWATLTPLLRARLRTMPLDTEALAGLALSDNEAARDIAASVVTETAHRWIRDDAVAVSLLLGPHVLREAAVRLLRAAAPSLPQAVRSAYVARLVATLDAPLPAADDAFDGLAEVVDLFATDLAAQVSVDTARRLLERHAAGAAVAAAVIGSRPDALTLLGPAEVQRLAQCPDAASRSVVVAMLHAHGTPFAERFGLLLELVEGEWDDVRQAGVQVVARLGPSIAPKDGPANVDRALAIIDSTWPVVQDQGCAFVRTILTHGTDAAASQKLLSCLAEHPHPNMRQFVLDLADGLIGPGLPAGVHALHGLAPLLRSVLFDVRPRVALRRRAVALLVARGQVDAEQSVLATQILVDVARSQTMSLRDDALAGIGILASEYASAHQVAATDGIVVGGAA